MSVHGLEPSRVWAHFADLSAIPRCSKDEARVLAHLKTLAEQWGLSWAQDAVGNIVIRKPASPGREQSPITLLQAHVDMVCEQNRGGHHDFSCDPIEFVVEDEWVSADGTTLGADNGLGVALILAVLEDRSLVHGPLEGLFTVDEETEMTGATDLDPALVKGRIILNLDGEGDGQFLVGSAGGGTVTGRIALTRVAAHAPAGWTVLLGGLEGGHSGVEIHRQTGNSLSLAARFAAAFLDRHPEWHLASLEGGDKDNAIPREAQLTWAGPVDGAALRTFASEFSALCAAELGPEGQKLVFEVAPSPRPDKVLDPPVRQRLLDLLVTLPDGVLGMSKVVPGLVETSCNLANVRMAADAVVILSPRSSVPSSLEALLRRLEAGFRLAGGTAELGAAYPPWPPQAQSRLRDLAPPLWQKVTGTPATVLLVHAGLECGQLAEKFPESDMISFGPLLVDVHTPRERVSVPSVQRVHRFLLSLLESL